MNLTIEGKIHNLYYNSKNIYFSFNNLSYSIIPEEVNKFIDVAIGDIIPNGSDEILVLIGDEGGNFANELIIYDVQVDSGKLEINEVYRNNLSVIKPWKIEICNLDNDGEMEIFMAVNKGTYYYHDIGNRPFFFNFRNNGLVKKWTGSRVRAPFTDVYFTDFNGNGSDEFIVIEKAENGGAMVAVYYWFGFGFILQAESQIYDNITSISSVKLDNENLLEITIKEHHRVRRVLLEPSTVETDNGIYFLKERGHLDV
ncbi:hypothetical protein [Alkaliphilus peptidifermentans]|uniref:Repeat domain-containing protein n=1 Tax=Alkaliphilus peptidifermentans DSM 18978 TaxID=1120976 RepID=A0A1G5JLV7_9FIRM|nr:hypothetical protein [Alkaliphilus peptidifermentans]SCY89365.1 hypothetical protein SAMN03080606_02925 [Alkaliphilus peptidifermentans DSM 18978]